MTTPSTPPWWESFFVDFWPHLRGFGVDDARIMQEVEQIERKLSLAPGARVLDVPCGRGRHVVELAHRGYSMTGVDISPPLLDQARERAKSVGVQLDLQVRDMRDLPWPSTFDGAYCYRTSIGHFDEEGDRTLLAAILACLRPGARFLLEAAVAETIFPRFSERSWVASGGNYLLERRQFNPLSARLDVDWVHTTPGGQTRTAVSSLRVYGCREVIQLLSEAGFTSIKVTQALGEQPFQQLGERATFVATRP